MPESSTEQKRDHFTSQFRLFFAVLRLELRAYTLSHSASPFFVMSFFREGLSDYLPGLALNHNPLNLCLLSS
jgi:hypothetical protein